MFEKPDKVEVKISPSASYIGSAGEKISDKIGEITLNLLWFGNDDFEVAKMLKGFEEQIAQAIWAPVLKKGSYPYSSDGKIIVAFDVKSEADDNWKTSHKNIVEIKIPFNKSGGPIDRLHTACLAYFARYRSLETAINSAVEKITCKPDLYTKADMTRFVNRIFWEQQKEHKSWYDKTVKPPKAPARTGAYWNCGVYKWDGGYKDWEFWQEIVKSVVVTSEHRRSHVVAMIVARLQEQSKERAAHQLLDSYMPAWARKTELPASPEDDPGTVDAIEQAAQIKRDEAERKSKTVYKKRVA